MVTIHDILTFLDSNPARSNVESAQLFAERNGISSEVSLSMFNVAEDLGYIDDTDSITEKGTQYLEDCSTIPEYYGTLTLIRGLPGAGKTNLGNTLLLDKQLHGNTNAVHLESDMFMVDAAGNYKFQLDKVKASNVECIAQAERYLRLGYDVIVSNAFAQYWELRPYYDIAAELNIKTILIEMYSQFNSDRRSAKTRQHMVEKWDKVFLPRSWSGYGKDKDSSRSAESKEPQRD